VPSANQTSPGGPDASVTDASSSSAKDGTPAQDGASGPDASLTDASVPDQSAVDAGTYRTSLEVCWKDPSCTRALVVSHGGDWDLGTPYGSRGAFDRAVQNGADGIKTDLRMTQDGVAVVAHSSPIEVYESLDCAGRKIEEMTGAQVAGCHIFPSTSETFQRVSDVLTWARGKVVIMLTVKEARDFPAAIALVNSAGAGNYVYYEVNVSEMQGIVLTAPNWDKLNYMVNLGSPADADLMLDTVKNPRVFMYELDPDYPGGNDATTASQFASRIHLAGKRPFAASDTKNATVDNHLARFNEGFDTVMSYDLKNGVIARTQANQSRGVSPP